MLTSIQTAASVRSESIPWNPDLGNGNYQNPVLYADYSDPDAICVGQDYWMTASSFCCIPGLPILHSTDLVNWTIVNHALKALPPREHYSIHRAGCGVWAPAIRFHDGLFWIFFPDPDFGIYVTTAKNPRGDWSEPHLLKPGKGIIDPCPFWDEDGRNYLIHAWAKSRSGIKNILTLQEIDDNATQLIGEPVTIIDGNQMDGWHTIEGPKLYRSHGYYWIFAPAGGVSEGYQAVFRSRSITGPYEPRIVLEQGDTPINGPHQGAWIETPSGEHWFLHFQEKFPHGRVVHLQPMNWTPDNWPVMGKTVGIQLPGNPVTQHRKPTTEFPENSNSPHTSDDFLDGKPGKQWQWQSNPNPLWLATQPTAHPNGLTLNCFPRHQGNNLWTSGNLLLQKITGPAFVAETELIFEPSNTGDRAGLILFGYDYFWIGLKKSADGIKLVVNTCFNADRAATEKEQIIATVEETSVRLQAVFTEPNQLQFSWAFPGQSFQDVNAKWETRHSKWVGAKIGLFSSTEPETTTMGHAHFTKFLIKHH